MTLPAKRADDRRQRLLLLALLVLGFLGLKLAFNPGIGRNSLDGDFYYQIARNVQEGRGLKTNLSLYHQGIKSFPQKTNMAPLWPLTLGYSGRWMGLSRAAGTVPEILFLVDLVLLYFLANLLAQRLDGGATAGLLLPEHSRMFDIGHLAVLLFGLNPVFFEFTSLPYTEAMSFGFLFSALLAVDRARNGSLLWAAGAGVLAAAAFMTRAQMIGVLVAVPASLAVAGIRERRLLASALCAVGAAFLALVPWILFLQTFIDPFDPWVMVSLSKYRESPEIRPFQQSLAAEDLGARISDWARGIQVAFDPWNRDSYLASFGWAAWLVPLAMLRLARSMRRLLSQRWALLDRRHLLALATALAAAGSLAPIHNRPNIFFKEWLFGFRHGLPLVLLVCMALTALLARPGRGWRALALGLAVATIISSSLRVNALLERRFPSGLFEVERETVAWLDSQPDSPSVITTNAQTLSAFSRSGFHWMSCTESSEKTLQLLRLSGADYVLLYPGEDKCKFLSGLEDELRLVKVFPSEPFQIGVLALQ